MRTIALVLLASMVAAACTRRVTVTPGPQGNVSARAELITVTGQSAGTATLTQTPNGVLIAGQLSNIPPGTHAIHLHEVGECEPPFQSAGGHFAPGGNTHGYLSANGPHAGDLPNITATEGGTARFDIFAAGLRLATGDNQLLDDDGAALVVHAGADDYYSDPAGNAGSRIACGVIRR